jgi:glucosamine-phosphate N-acetyltransferase
MDYMNNNYSDEESLFYLKNFNLHFSSELLNQKFKIRSLSSHDYDKGFMEVLSQLTIVGDHTKEKWLLQFGEMKKIPNTYYIIVIEDLNSKKIVATGSLLIEKKFIRNMDTCGHIEDVVVDKKYRMHHLFYFFIFLIFYCRWS